MIVKKIFLFLSLVTSVAFAQEKDTVAIKYSQTIIKEDLQKHLNILASDEYEGRETGQRGQKMAAEYISTQFKSFGIPEIKEIGYYQQYPLLIKNPQKIEISIGGKKFEDKKDFYSFPGLDKGNISSSSITFLGYGISSEKYDDYKNVEVKDNVLLILSGEPISKDSISFVTDKKELSPQSSSRKKIETARTKGAAALLIVVDDFDNSVKRLKHFLESPSMQLQKKVDEKEKEKQMPVIFISQNMADEILKKSNTKIENQKERIRAVKKPQSIKSKSKVSINIKTDYKNSSAENVLGYIEGTDKKDELIVVTAHYDHLGKEGDVVFNGADDDGSGTVTVVELAEAFAKAKKEGHGPRRSMLFMTVSGEEKGLLGSEYYSENPVFPLDKTVANLNIDMIGRLDEKHEDNPNYVYIIGSTMLSTKLHDINEEANKKYTGLELDYTYNDKNDKNRYYYRSDHYNFAKNNIPVIFYFNGVHEDYHKETDEVQKINFEKMEKIGRLVFFTAWELANRNERIVVDVK